MVEFLQIHEWRGSFLISDIRRTGTTLAEDGKAVLVWTFRGKMATLAETADDLSSAGGLGELLANLLFLRRFFVCCGLGGEHSSVKFLVSQNQTLTFPPARRDNETSSPTVVVARSGPGLLPVDHVDMCFSKKKKTPSQRTFLLSKLRPLFPLSYGMIDE